MCLYSEILIYSYFHFSPFEITRLLSEILIEKGLHYNKLCEIKQRFNLISEVISQDYWLDLKKKCFIVVNQRDSGEKLVSKN
mmetsp:Transcript_6091/g.12773  ORF Transcript_6091/g.12773 Transcript_6091/m.12773 type:complete len:82 (+) Transcript_6091:115-360(+)